MEFEVLTGLGLKITREGCVYSTITNKQLKPSRDPAGYARVYTYISGKRKGYFVHRLLALAFIPNPENKPCVNHKNSTKTDNSLENLEWCTHKENSVHASRAGMYTTHAKRSVTRKLRNKAMKVLIENGFKHIEVAGLFGTCSTNVTAIMKNNNQRERI